MKNFDLSTLAPMSRQHLKQRAFELEAGIRLDAIEYQEGETKKEMLGWAESLRNLGYSLRDQDIADTNYIQVVTLLSTMKERAAPLGFLDDEPIQVLRSTIKSALSSDEIDYPHTPTAWKIYSTSGADAIAAMLCAKTKRIVKILKSSTFSEIVQILDLFDIELSYE